MIFLSTPSGEVKGFAFEVISKVQFTGKENQQKDWFIYFLKILSLCRNIRCNCYIIVSGYGLESLSLTRQMGEDTNVLWLILLKVVRIFTRLKEKLMREERNIEIVTYD